MPLWKVTDSTTGRYAVVTADRKCSAKGKGWAALKRTATYRDLVVERHGIEE